MLKKTLHFLTLLAFASVAHAAAPTIEPTGDSIPKGSEAAEPIADVERVAARNVGVRTAPCRQTPCPLLPDGNLLGNGDVGVVVAGSTAKQDFYIGKNDFWAPTTVYGYLRTDVPPLASRIGQQAYPIGGISIEIPCLEQAEFRQEMDLYHAESRNLATKGDVTIATTARVPANADMLLVELENRGTTPAEITVTTWTRPSNLGRVTEQDMARVPDVSAAGAEGDILWITRDSTTAPGDRWVAHAAIATRVLGAAYEPTAAGSLNVGGTFALPPGQRVVVVAQVGNAVSFSDEFPLATVKKLVVNGTESLPKAKADVAQVTLDAVREISAEHREWWRKYWQKSFIELPDEPILERFYYGAVYLMGAGARAGKVAPGLFGPWSTMDKPAWSADYHLNYNHQHPWYGAYACNRPELAIPYVDSVVNLLPLARETGRAMREEGAVFKTGAGPYGWSHPSTHGMPNNAELAINLRDYFEFTRDIDFLRDVSYPFMKEVAANWDKRLVRQEGPSGAAADYRYTIRLAWDERMKIHDNPTSALAIVRALYEALVRSSEILDTDPELRERWREIVAHWSDYPTTEYQGKTVFDFAEAAHSPEGNPYPYNTYPFYPTANEGIDSKYRQVLVDTLATRPSYWTQVNAFTQVYAAAAQAGYPADELLEHLRTWTGRVLEPNGVARIPGHMTIDNAFAVNNVTLLLLQSHGGCIRVFPVWNLEKPARFVDLRARGAFLVSSEVADGVIRHVHIKSEKGGPVSIVNPWPGKSLSVVEAGGARVETEQKGDLHTFPTVASREYQLAPLPDVR